MKKTALVLIGIYLGIVFFMPKESIFYKIEEYLPVKITADLSSTPISLNIKKADIYYAGIKSATIKNSEIYPFLFYNEAKINIFVNSLDINLSGIKLIYTPFVPFKIFVKGKDITGDIELKNRKIHILFLHPQNEIKDFLQKTKKGYELNERF